VANPTSSSAKTFSGHDDNFESMVVIFPDRIKGQDLTPLKKKYPFSISYE
jgi:hypothetical protein